MSVSHTDRYESAVFLVIGASLLSISIDAIQNVQRSEPIGRTAGIDDVLWNTLGAYIGSPYCERGGNAYRSATLTNGERSR